MTDTEFDTWYDYHLGYFPGVDGWMKTKVPNKPATFAAWRKTLARISLEDAKAATEALYHQAGETKGFGKHAAIIARLAGQIAADRAPEQPRAQYVDGEQVYRCLVCHDIGTVIVWHDYTVAIAAGKVANQKLAPGTKWSNLYTMALGCCCAAGERWKHIGRYDEKNYLMPDLHHTRAEQVEVLTAFAATRYRPKTFPEFDAFAEE